MSGHSVKAKSRHPDAPRDHHQVGHITFEIMPADGTFALIAGEAVLQKDRRPLFTGFVEKGMATQLRKLAHAIDEIEAVL